MPRRPIKKKRTVFPDPIYNSVSVHMLVNRVMKNGKKSLAYRIMYSSMNQLAKTTQQDPLIVIELCAKFPPVI